MTIISDKLQYRCNTWEEQMHFRTGSINITRKLTNINPNYRVIFTYIQNSFKDFQLYSSNRMFINQIRKTLATKLSGSWNSSQINFVAWNCHSKNCMCSYFNFRSPQKRATNGVTPMCRNVNKLDEIHTSSLCLTAAATVSAVLARQLL